MANITSQDLLDDTYGYLRLCLHRCCKQLNLIESRYIQLYQRSQMCDEIKRDFWMIQLTTMRGILSVYEEYGYRKVEELIDLHYKIYGYNIILNDDVRELDLNDLNDALREMDEDESEVEEL